MGVIYITNDQYSYLKDDSSFAMRRLTFMYVPFSEDSRASLSFHLTAAEKNDVLASFKTNYNQATLKELLKELKR